MTLKQIMPKHVPNANNIILRVEARAGQQMLFTLSEYKGKGLTLSVSDPTYSGSSNLVQWFKIRIPPENTFHLNTNMSKLKSLDRKEKSVI